jgi:hypothetical protein
VVIIKRKNLTKLKIIFGIVILSLSFVLPFEPVSAPLTVVNIDDDDVQVGDVITVWGPPGQVTPGATINGYWDIPQGANAWLLNTTTGQPDSSYSFKITVPDTVIGSHYIWVEDTSMQRLVISSVITVNPGFVIPEYPLGTISTIAASLIALLLIGRRRELI